ncbi:hypothetical protein NL676_039889 [Syzygium grande]|nr:hypothetical protein NL676_039889 [Syzygium grande]
MHQEDYFSLSDGLSSGTFSLQGQMRSILMLLQLTLSNQRVGSNNSFRCSNYNFCSREMHSYSSLLVVV